MKINKGAKMWMKLFCKCKTKNLYSFAMKKGFQKNETKYFAGPKKGLPQYKQSQDQCSEGLLDGCLNEMVGYIGGLYTVYHFQ
jgi:hypothetical protein